MSQLVQVHIFLLRMCVCVFFLTFEEEFMHRRIIRKIKKTEKNAFAKDLKHMKLTLEELFQQDMTFYFKIFFSLNRI